MQPRGMNRELGMQNTLGLDDDLDGIELVQELELVFDVEVSDREAERILTVGEFYDLLLSKLPQNDADKKCTTAMAFYRLRSALRLLGYGDKLAPASDIRALERGGTKSNLKKLASKAGLRMPKTVSTRGGQLAALFGFILVLAGVSWVSPEAGSMALGTMAALIFAGAILQYADPGKLPPHCVTLGDLARRAAPLNYGRLIKMGARHRDQDIWEFLVEALSGYALPKSEINRDTVFLETEYLQMCKTQLSSGGRGVRMG